MKKLYAICFVLLSACSGQNPTYAHNTNAPCPPSVQIADSVTAEFAKYPQNSLMAQFYKHYTEQQRALAAYSGKDVNDHCPAAFWVSDSVAAEFKKYPEGSAMREFFKTYVAQQRALDQYYSPTPLLNNSNADYNTDQPVIPR